MPAHLVEHGQDVLALETLQRPALPDSIRDELALDGVRCDLRGRYRRERGGHGVPPGFRARRQPTEEAPSRVARLPPSVYLSDLPRASSSGGSSPRRISVTPVVQLDPGPSEAPSECSP